MGTKAEPPPVPWRLRDDRVVQLAVCAAVLQILIVWLPILPLGVPGEWTWPRIRYDEGTAAALFLGILAAAPAAVAYVAVCRLADPTRDGRPARIAPRLALLAIAGFAWLWASQDAAPRNYDALGRSSLVLFYPNFSGYFTEARRIDDLGDYLGSYESLMAEGDVLHLGTHPPGLIVGQRLLLDLFESNPRLTRIALATRPASVAATTHVIGETLGAAPGKTGVPPDAAEQAELWFAALLVQAAAAAAVFPLYRLTSGTTGKAAAWRTACLWPLVPALAVFLPKSDALLPLIGLSVLALWHRPGPPGPARAAAAGAVFWLGMVVSLAMLPVAALAGALAAAGIAASPREARRSVVSGTLKAAGIAAGTFIALTLLIRFVFDLDLFAVWSWNYRNHAAFYSQYVRAYWKWLLVSPIELAFAVGLPVAAAAAARSGFTSLRSPALPVAVVVGLLWISGKNSGEVARLWLFLMPWLLWTAASVWEGRAGRARWTAVLILQLVAGFATAVRVSGFGFEELAGVSG